MEEKRWKTSENKWKIDENCWKNNEKARNPTPNKKTKKNANLIPRPFWIVFPSFESERFKMSQLNVIFF
jgi:hypothetical protein